MTDAELPRPTEHFDPSFHSSNDRATVAEESAGRNGLFAEPDDDSCIPPPTLTPPQLDAAREIAREDGAWARARIDGTAEVFTAYRGGLQRHVLATDGETLEVETIPRGARYIHGRRLAVAAVSGAAVSAALLWRTDTGGIAWLVPVAFVVAFMIVAAACLGLYRRLPAPTWDTGGWTGFPSDREGDVSGHTMPGFVRTHPFFGAFWLPGPCVGGAVLFSEQRWLDPPYSTAAGVAVGTFVWWWIMLCFSRGWIGEGD